MPRKGQEEGWPAKGAKRKKGRVKTGQRLFLKNSLKRFLGNWVIRCQGLMKHTFGRQGGGIRSLNLKLDCSRLLLLFTPFAQVLQLLVHLFGGRALPKGPFRTKNTTALNSVVFYYCRSLSLSVAISSLISL